MRASAAGRVSFTGKVAGRGVLTIELANSGKPPLRTTYEPVRPSIRKGDRVRAGQTVGTLARKGTSHCTKRCLHWGLLRGDRYLNPLSLLPAHMLRAGHMRLLPLTEPVPSEKSPQPSDSPPTDQPQPSALSGRGDPGSVPTLHNHSGQTRTAPNGTATATLTTKADSQHEEVRLPTSTGNGTDYTKGLLLTGALALGATWTHSRLRRRANTANSPNGIPEPRPHP